MIPIFTDFSDDVLSGLVQIILFHAMQYLYMIIVELFVALYDSLIWFLDMTFFDHNFVSGLLSFFEIVGATMLVIGFVKTVICEAERQLHGEGFSLGARTLDFLKAFGLLLFCRPIVIGSHEFMIDIANLITADLYVEVAPLVEGWGETWPPQFPALEGGIGTDDSQFWMGLLFIIIAVVCTCIILFTILRQYAIIVVQIFTGYLYVYDVAAGNSNAIGEWGRDMIGARLSFALHLVFYKFGMYEFVSGFEQFELDRLLVSVVFLLGASMVPSIMKRWGYANQTGNGAIGRFVGGAAQSATSVASTAVGIAL